MPHFGTLLHMWQCPDMTFQDVSDLNAQSYTKYHTKLTNYCLYQLDLYITALPRQPVRFSIFCGYGIGNKILQNSAKKCGKNICFKIGASESAIYSQTKVRKINRWRSKVTLTRGWVCFQASNSPVLFQRKTSLYVTFSTFPIIYWPCHDIMHPSIWNLNTPSLGIPQAFFFGGEGLLRLQTIYW